MILSSKAIMKLQVLTALFLTCIDGVRSSSSIPQSVCGAPSTVTTTVYSTVVVNASAEEHCDHPTPTSTLGSLSNDVSAGYTRTVRDPSAETPAPMGVSSGLKNMLYFGKWTIYELGFKPQEIPAQDVTHILYAFGDVSPDGRVDSDDSYADTDYRFDGDSQVVPDFSNVYGNIKQLFLHKTRNRRLKTLLSIGGWTYSESGKFVGAAATPESRALFASSAVRVLADWGFDGLDIDWEYPANENEAANYILLLQECRKALDDYARQRGQSYHYLLTVASPANEGHYGIQNLAALSNAVDSIHLMAYDYAGSWDAVAGHQANLYAGPGTSFSTNDTVSDYISRGVEPSKLVLGLPLYGRAFTNTAGIDTPFEGVGAGTVQDSVWEYRDLPRPGSSVTVDHALGAAYSYDAAKQELVTFDNAETVQIKANYIKEKGLGGAFFWEAVGDKKGDESLVRVMADNMRGGLDDSPNMLDYPDSRWANIRNRMQ